MADTPPFLPRPVRRMGLGVAGDADIERMIAVEMPVSIEVQGLAYAVMMATPADIEDFAWGFALTEGVVTGPDDVEAARAALLETSTALDAGDDRGYHEATRRFHLSLIAPSGMQRLLRMYESAWNLTEPVRPMTHVGPAQRSAFAHDHDAMLEAFESRDATALVALSVEHYDHLLDGIEVLSDDHDVFREA